MASAWRPRIGLVTVRFTLFDAQMAPDFPARMRAHASAARTSANEAGLDVCFPATASARSMMDGMSPNCARPARNASTATSLAAFSIAGAVPPSRKAA